MRLRREQRQEAVDIQIEASPVVYPEFKPEQHVVLVNPHEAEESFASADQAIIYHKTEEDSNPTPLFSVGDRFSSLLGTGLKVELLEHTEYTEEKGWKCTVKVLAPGDNGHVKRGSTSFTYEANLVENFEPLEKTERIVERKKRGEAKTEEPDTPHVNLPTIYSGPWNDWPFPDLSGGAFQDFQVTADKGYLALSQKSTGNCLGDLTVTAIEELGKRAQFPPEFIGKLTPATAAIVINERIEGAKAENIQVVFENGKFCNILPSWRGILPTKQVAELVYQQLKGWYPDTEIVFAEHENGAAKFRFLTPVVYPVTQTANDSLRLGIDVTHQYGDTLRVALYTRRIASGGGMLSFKSEYSWKKRSGDAGSANSQATWLIDEVTRAVCGFTALIEKAKLMSETKLIGDGKKLFKERASSMGVTKRRIDQAIKCFEQEPGDTEWAWACAASRFAALPDTDPDLSRRVMIAMGTCVENFEPGQEFAGLVGVSEDDE